MNSEYRVLIDGELCESSTKETMEIVNPANGKVIAHAPRCGSSEIDRAAEAAWNAASAWAETSPTDRAALFFKMAELLRAHREEWAKLETMQYGGPIFKTYNFDMRFDAEHFEFMAGVGRAVTGRSAGYVHDNPPAPGGSRIDYTLEFSARDGDFKNNSRTDDGKYRSSETPLLCPADRFETG